MFDTDTPVDFAAKLKAVQDEAQAALPDAIAEVDRTAGNLSHAKDENDAAKAALEAIRAVLPKPPRAARGSKKAAAKK